ncbi:MAG TPA: spore germination protein GerW family protein [Micromonosporaceae bacterium]
MATLTSPLEVIRTAVTTTAEKVYTEPIRHEDLVVIPAASVGGGGGGGGGSAEQDRPGSGTGEGGGFGLKAKPAGAFVIKQGKVRWQPAVDVNRIVLGAQVVAVTALLVVRAVILRGSRARMGRKRPRAIRATTQQRRIRQSVR